MNIEKSEVFDTIAEKELDRLFSILTDTNLPADTREFAKKGIQKIYDILFIGPILVSDKELEPGSIQFR